MQIYLFLLLILLSSCASEGGRKGTNAVERTLQNVYSVKIDLNGDKEEDSIVLQIPLYWLDSGDFTRIVFDIAGQRKHAFDNPEGWVSYDKYRTMAEAGQSVPGPNAVDSRMLSLIKIAENDFRLLLFGIPGAQQPGKIFVFSIIGGSVKVDFHGPLEVIQVRDLDNDRVPEIIGNACYTRQFGTGQNFFSYTPYLVYKLNNGFRLSETLTEEYNRLSYFGYAGLKCSEDTIVVKTEDSTVIMDLKRAQLIYGE